MTTTTTTGDTPTTTAPDATSAPTPRDATRNNARAGGIFYLLTFAASLPAFFLDPILKDSGYIVGPGPDTRVLWACFLDAVIMIGAVALLTAVLLRQDPAQGTDAPAPTTTGQALVTARNLTFLFGPGFMARLNAVLFGSLLHRSRLVPRLIPTLGRVGAPLLLAATLLTFLVLNTQTGAWTMLATLPIAAWELSVGCYMAFKGFRPAAVSSLPE